MIKTLLVGLWVAAVALGSAYGAVMFGGSASSHDKDEQAAEIEYVKSESLSVPVIRSGKVEGYVVAQMSFAVEMPESGESAELTPYLIDAAFRALYESAPLDFTRLKAEDLSTITAKAKNYANASLGHQAVKDALMAELNFVAREEVRTNWAKKKY